MKVTHGKLKGLSNAHEEIKKMNEAAIKNLELQMGQTSTQLANLKRPEFYGTTLDNPRNETLKMIEVVKEGATTKKGLMEAHSLKDESKEEEKLHIGFLFRRSDTRPQIERKHDVTVTF